MDLAGGPRILQVNDAPVRSSGDFVLYWMIATRRTTSNYSLDRAIEWAEALRRPLLVLEALRSDYPWASDRHHRFVIDGMRDNAAALAATPAMYYPYVEPAHGAGKGLLDALAQRACVIVTDEFPCFFLPRMVRAAGRHAPVRLEAVDSNGVFPLRAAGRTYAAAAHFRRFVQSQLRDHLPRFSSPQPFENRQLPGLRQLPPGIEDRWPAAGRQLLNRDPQALRRLPIDHDVPVAPIEGGPVAAHSALRSFVKSRVESYHVAHNHPDDDGTSRLSPYLHFGHVSAQDIFTAVMRREKWSAAKLAGRATGAREGWWGVGPGAEAYLDQLIVWRELAFNACATRPEDYDHFESLPNWALETLERHSSDDRPFRYSLAQFESARTHDPLWNAAQQQLRQDGWFHNYMRMLWGKKILEWSESPRQALHIMRSLMDRWSLDGRDPNSYAGYFWTLGRYDRPWPERPIYGTVRSMSSDRARKKVRVQQYLLRYDPGETGGVPRQESLLPR